MRKRWGLGVGLLAWLTVGAVADRFDNWDRNKDGVLQREELPPGLRGKFDAVDVDKNGVISREEDAAMARRRRPGPEALPGAGEFRILKDCDYVGAGNPRQTLDLFLPREKAAAPRPLVVFVHGGGWRNGSKEGGLRRLMPILESKQYVGASLNYRLTGEAGWPAQIHDCKAAIRWLKAHARDYGYDPERIAVWGTSAGGHLVAMLGVTGDSPALEGALGDHLEQSSAVTCVVDYFGPANLLTMNDHPSTIDHGAADSPEGKLVGGALAEHEETARNASPVTHVSKGDAPILIAHGSADSLVPHQQSVEFSKRLLEGGVPVSFITMKDAGHGFRSEELERRVATFLAHHLLGRKSEVATDPIPKGK